MSVTAFLTDSTLCIGCKACEVACKQWNGIDDDGLHWSGFSYDNTGSVGASTWRHVKFVEQPPVPGLGGNAGEQTSWTFSSDVCKHCEEAGCLEACPTGSIVRTEFGGVFIQPDVCNGCGYCVTSCPFGVVERHSKDGRAFKCTFCYDRQKAGWSRHAQRFVRPNRLSLERSRNCEHMPASGWKNCVREASMTQPFMTRVTRRLAALMPYSLSEATRAVTICRPIPRCLPHI